MDAERLGPATDDRATKKRRGGHRADAVNDNRDQNRRLQEEQELARAGQVIDDAEHVTRTVQGAVIAGDVEPADAAWAAQAHAQVRRTATTVAGRDPGLALRARQVAARADEARHSAEVDMEM